MKTNIGVFFGGRSTEHEISVISASQAMHAINRDKYDVTPIYISKQGKWYTGDALFDVANYRDINSLLAKCQEVYMRPIYDDYNLYKTKKPLFGTDVLTRLDVVIPVLHGSNVEDGIFEGVLQTIGIPYAGCDVLASANGMDKITMKMILQACDIPVVDYVWFTDKQWFAKRDELIAQIENKLGYPVIVKPANLGSSVGIGCAHNREELIDKVDAAEQYSTRLIVEYMVKDLQEINCSVIGDCNEYRMSVLEQPLTSQDILTYTDKYMGGTKGAKGMAASQKKFPADLPDAETKRIQFLAGETFRALSCHGVSRVDVMIEGKSERDASGCRKIFVNEINTIPGSLSFYLWEGSGLKFDEEMEHLVQLALKRKREQGMKTVSYDQNIFSLGGGIKGGKMGKLGK
ncbi:MAG: D-alanine--D-alanine ligase family protein [Muribaculaceae bacterium]|nr:D-alanine--D-alanine ligase family protein [Muribaculaceae bacterium]